MLITIPTSVVSIEAWDNRDVLRYKLKKFGPIIRGDDEGSQTTEGGEQLGTALNQVAAKSAKDDKRRPVIYSFTEPQVRKYAFRPADRKRKKRDRDRRI